ncbi:MAG: arylsulfatase A-like enzyme [Pseudohongiellaceae bacterium]|jgi:arylsulfatase A-like enzyme
MLSTTPPSTAVRLALFVALSCCLAACQEPLPVSPGVLLVTFDTTRADRLGSYGHVNAATPHLDALARRGLQFDAAYTPTPLTLPAHASLFTGTWPLSHGVRDNTLFTLGPGTRTLPDALAQRGWRTGAAVGAFVLDARYGLDQGFDHYVGPPAARPNAPTIAERSATVVTNDALDWLAGVANDEPFFLWVHYFDPHHPYQAPAPFSSSVADAYDAEISYADSEFGRLLDTLQNSGRMEDTLIIATADHGDSLGEHGEQSHGFFLYDAAVKVPLIVAGPRVSPGRSQTPVSLVDIAPTVLDWCDVPATALPETVGVSLLGEQLDGSANERPLYFETFLPFYTKRWAPMQGLLWQGHKFIQTRRPELYDLGADPAELTNLIDDDPETALTLKRRLTDLINGHPILNNAVVDPARARDLQALAALGYTAGTLGGDPFDQDLPDAKDGIADIVKEGTALFDLREGRRLLGLPPGPSGLQPGANPAGLARLERARAYYGELVVSFPERLDLLAQWATAQHSLGLFELAATTWETVVLRQDRVAQSHLSLGFSYAALGNDDWARAEMVKAVALNRQENGAFDWLAEHHEAQQRLGRAAFWRAEQERFVRGQDATRQTARSERQRLEALAAEQSQAMTGPDDYPKPDLTPERLREPSQ